MRLIWDYESMRLIIVPVTKLIWQKLFKTWNTLAMSMLFSCLLMFINVCSSDADILSSSSYLWSGSAVLAKTASVINSERDKNIRVCRACMCVSVFHMKCLKLWLCTCMTELKKHVLPRLLRPLTLTTPELPAAAAFCLLGLSSCFEQLFCFSLFSFSSSSVCSAGFVSKLSSCLLSAEYVCFL